MMNSKYETLFNSLVDITFKEFLELLFEGISEEMRKTIVLEDVSYHRLNANIVTLEAWMCLAPIETNQWIWVRLEKDTSSGSIQKCFYVNDLYGKESLHSLQACINYYKNKA